MRIFASRASSSGRGGRCSSDQRSLASVFHESPESAGRHASRNEPRIHSPLSIYIGTVVQHLFPHPTISDPGQHATGITPLTSCPAIQATSKSGHGDTWIFEIDGLMSSTHFTHGSRTSTVYSEGCLPAQIPLFMTPAHLHPQIMTSSAPTCTFRSRTITPTPLTRTSVRNGILADPPDTRSEVR